jgi:hypothetical protein
MDLGEFFEKVVDKARTRARARVAAVRAAHPGEDREALGRRLVRSAANRAGLYGAATGTLALVTLPVGVPAGIAATLLVEAELIFALLEVFDIDTGGEAGRVRLFALWAGAGFADAAKNAGLSAGASALGRILRDSLPGRIIRRLNPELIRAILKRLGLGWLPRTLKLWPVLGAPISFALDRAAVRALGEATLAALQEEGSQRPQAPGTRRIKVRRAARRPATV